MLYNRVYTWTTLRPGLTKGLPMFIRATLLSLLLTLAITDTMICFAGQTAELENRLLQSAACIREIMDAPDASIPKDLLRRSTAIIIFPSVLKVGLGLGGQYGKGVALRKDPGALKWGPPAFFSMYGASVGWQMGVQTTDLILLVMSEMSLKGLFKDRFTVGVDASVAAGPIGRDASAATDLALTANILSYSRAKGLFMGVAISGGIIELDWDANEKYYGSDVSIIDLFFKGVGDLSPAGAKLVEALNKISTTR